PLVDAAPDMAPLVDAAPDMAPLVDAAPDMAPLVDAAPDMAPLVDAAPDMAPPSDEDQDGFPDELDNCPHIANPEQTNSDGDTQGDACDEDRDGDEILNDMDLCPDVPGPNTDMDNDTIGDICDEDRDGDEILNDDDNCPEVRNTTQLDWDENGVGDLCDAPHAEIELGGLEAGSLRVFDTLRGGLRVQVNVTRSGDYLTQLWLSDDPACQTALSAPRRESQRFEITQQPNVVVFTDVVSRWRVDVPTQPAPADLYLCVSVELRVDDEALLAGTLVTSVEFHDEVPNLSARLTYAGLWVEGEVRSETPPTLFVGMDCQLAPRAPNSREGDYALWWLPGAPANPTTLNGRAGWSISLMLNDTPRCFPLPVYTLLHACVQGERVEARSGRVLGEPEIGDACLEAEIIDERVRLSGLCDALEGCYTSADNDFGRLDLWVYATEGRSPRVTRPRGVSHGLPATSRHDTLTDLIGVRVDDPLKGLHLIGAGQYRHLTREPNGAWTSTEQPWNNQTRLAAADVYPDGRLDLVLSNSSVWGSFSLNRVTAPPWLQLNTNLGFIDHRFATAIAVGDLDQDETNLDVALIAELGNPQNTPTNPYYPDGPADPDPVALVYRSISGPIPRTSAGFIDLGVDKPTGVLTADIFPSGDEAVIITRDASSDINNAASLGLFRFLDDGEVFEQRWLMGPPQRGAAPTLARWDLHRDVIIFGRGADVVVADIGMSGDLYEVTTAPVSEGGAMITSIAAGDINGDARDDLIVVDSLGRAFTLLRMDEDYDAPQGVDLERPVGRVIGFNAPGEPLEAALLYAQTLGFQIFSAADARPALVRSAAQLNARPGFVLEAAADLNGDGQDELLGRNGLNLEVYTWGVGAPYAAPDVRAYAVGDVEGDGLADLVIARLDAAEDTRLTVNYDPISAGGLQIDGAVALTVDDQLNRLAIGDVNGDGRGDIVACSDAVIYVFVIEGQNEAFSLAELGRANVTGGCQALIIADLIPGGGDEAVYIDGDEEGWRLGALEVFEDQLIAHTRSLQGAQPAELIAWRGVAGHPRPALIEISEGAGHISGLTAELMPQWSAPLPEGVIGGVTADLRGRLQRDLVMLLMASEEAAVHVMGLNAEEDALVTLAGSVVGGQGARALVVADINGDGVAEVIVQEGLSLRPLIWE
ncbi:thrombospondin type 3 repeat-containing protein, partial [Myxococcota bacterium]|nr:thrombospondin type 3 repeat-containing protein [Myxococcota bacterium]